jgi:outer membrane autotransporter protein
MNPVKIIGVALLLVASLGMPTSAWAAATTSGEVYPDTDPLTWTDSTIVYIGYGATPTGSLTINGGSSVTSSEAYLGYDLSGAQGTVTISDSASSWTINGNLYLGHDVGATGVVNQNDGTITVNGTVYLGYLSSSKGTYNLKGGTLALKGLEAGTGTAAFNFSGGTLQANAGFSTSVNATLVNTDTINTNGYDVTWSGALLGTGELIKTGEGTLTLSGTNTYDGGTTISAGTIAISSDSNLGNSTSVLTLNDGTLSCTQGFTILRAVTLGSSGGTIDTNAYDVTMNGTISGTGELVKTGDGTLTLSSYSYTGGSYVQSGTLALTNGYTSSSSSTLKIGITPTSNGVLAVTGAATVDGELDVISSSGTYTAGTKYTFLTATGGVSGTFDTVTDDLAFFDVALTYETNDIYFTLVSSGKNYVDEAHTGNQYAVASYLDAHASGATGDFATVLDALNLQTGDGARAAFNAMSGEIHGSLQTITMENSEHLLQTVAGRMRTQSMAQGDGSTSYETNRDSLVYVNRRTNSFDTLTQKMSGWTTWAESYGVGAAIASNGNASGLTYSTGGLMLGMERYLDENTLFGFGGGYAASSTTLSDRSDWGSIDGGQVCAYLHRDVGSHYLTGIAAFGYNQYSTKRYIDFGDIDRTATANYHGGSYSAYFETGRNVLGRFTHLQPFAALEYIGVQQNAFTEQDADSIDLDVGTSTANALRGILGSRVFDHFRTKSGHLVTVNASAAWRHEFLNDNRVIDTSFTSQTGNAFAVSGVNVDRDAALIGTGINYALSTHCSVYGNYDLLFSQNYTAHTGLGGFQYAW